MTENQSKPGCSEAKAADSASKVQGEGDYEAARRYNDSARAFVESVDLDQAARDAAPRGAAEASELARAEAAARARAKPQHPLPPVPVERDVPDDSTATSGHNRTRP